MTSRIGRTSAYAAALAIALAAGDAALAPGVAHAQSEEELNQARELFNEAYKDEQEKRYEEALEKFRRVAEVKESASVRYRIASCLEALNRLREARDAYRAVAAMKPSLPPNQQAVADSAAEKAVQIDKKIPKLVVTVSGENPPADARVTVDGAPVPPGKAVEQDPGEHVVQATASGMKPFEQRVTLPENGSIVPATVAFESEAPVEPPVEPPKKEGNRTLGVVALAAGGVMLATGIVLLVAREGSIDDIKTLCPDPSACPRSREAEVRDAEDQANLFLPLGVGFSVVGAAVAGYGLYAIVKKPSADPSAAPPPSTGASTGRVHFGPRFVRGGGMVGLTGTF